MLRWAAPQQHQSVGSAERGVRELKESLSVLRSDLNESGVDILFSFEGLSDALNMLLFVTTIFPRPEVGTEVLLK